MIQLLTFLLLCDKNTLFIAKQIAKLRFFHMPIARKKERKEEREILLLVDSYEILCG